MSKAKLLSRVRLFVTPRTIAHQAPPSVEFSRQGYRSGLPFPSYPILFDPMDCSRQAPPSMGFPSKNTGVVVTSFSRGSFWPRDQIWVSYTGRQILYHWAPSEPPALSWKWKLLSRVQFFGTLWTIKSMELSRPEYWNWYTFPSPGDLPNPGIKARSPALQADSLPAEPPGKFKNTGVGNLILLQRIFLTQESNQGLLHCRQILYQLGYQGSP